MKIIILSVFSIAVTLGVAACKTSDKLTSSGKEKKHIMQIKKDADYVQPVSNAAFTIDDWSIEGDIAKLIINYSGGCGTHKFKAFFTGNYMKSSPPKAGIFIQHESSGDKCRKLVIDTLNINLKTIRYEKGKSGTLVIGFNNTEKTLEYNY